MFKRIRYKYSFKFGRTEHFFARLLFVLLVINLVLFYHQEYGALKLFLVMSIVCWIIYWLSHRMEKLLHPNARR